MYTSHGTFLLAASFLVLGLTTAPAWAETIRADLVGYEEVPAISTEASGDFRARIDRNRNLLTYELTYENLSSGVLQAHIHFGQPGVNGGIAIFLCSNLGNGPAGTPACPGPTSGAVSGTVEAGDVVGPAGQGIAPGEFGEVLDAIRARVTYVNVHSTSFPGGEIRGRIR